MKATIRFLPSPSSPRSVEEAIREDVALADLLTAQHERLLVEINVPWLERTNFLELVVVDRAVRALDRHVGRIHIGDRAGVSGE